MSWSADQRERLGAEKKALEQKGLGVTWLNQGDANKTRVEWKFKSNSGKSYTVQVRLPPRYPYAKAELLVISPALRQEMYHPSHDHHTSMPVDGYPQILPHQRGGRTTHHLPHIAESALMGRSIRKHR